MALSLNFIPKRYFFVASTVVFTTFGVIFGIVLNEYNDLRLALVFSAISILFLIMSLLSASRGLLALLKVIVVPGVYILATFLLLDYFPNLNTIFKLTFLLASGLVYYFLLLSINIFLVVHEKGSVIPLVRPAKTTFLLIEVVTLFLFFTAVYKFLLPDPFTETTLIFQTIIIAVTSYLFIEQYWWSQGLENEITSFVGNESLVVAFLCAMFSISLSFYGTEAFFRSLALTACFFVSIDFFESIVTHRFNKKQFIEYFLISIVVGFLFLLG